MKTIPVNSSFAYNFRLHLHPGRRLAGRGTTCYYRSSLKIPFSLILFPTSRGKKNTQVVLFMEREDVGISSDCYEYRWCLFPTFFFRGMIFFSLSQCKGRLLFTCAIHRIGICALKNHKKSPVEKSNRKIFFELLSLFIVWASDNDQVFRCILFFFLILRFNLL